MKSKLLTLTLSSLLLASCGSIPYKETTYYFDYSYFTDRGFYISPIYETKFNYTPIGSITIHLQQGGESKDFKLKDIQTTYDKNGKMIPQFIISSGSNFTYITPTSFRMLVKVMEEVKKVGGNGIIGYSIDKDRSFITGIAIKREE